MKYLDFDIEIGKGTGQDYPVRVLRSPAGEARETMRFPFDAQALENELLKLENALLRSGGARRQALSPEQEAVQKFGRALFDSLLSGDVRDCYNVSLERAQQEHKGLRVRLRIEEPSLAALPWEFLYDHRRGEYVCLLADTPVIRYLQTPQPIRPLTVLGPLRILGMIASPVDLPRLDIDGERRRIELALASQSRAGLVEITWLDGQTWRDLQRAMRGSPWHVFHFIGHGGFSEAADEGLIYLANEDGRAKSLSASELGRLLASHRSLRLVFLSACEGARASRRNVFSSTASVLMRKGIPAVVAMQYPVTDSAAINLARTFYEALADGHSVDAAVVEARVAVSLALDNTLEWGTPVLHMRSPDGVLFQLNTQATNAHVKPPTDAFRPAVVSSSASTVRPIGSGVQQPLPSLNEPASRLISLWQRMRDAVSNRRAVMAGVLAVVALVAVIVFLFNDRDTTGKFPAALIADNSSPSDVLHPECVELIVNGGFEETLGWALMADPVPPVYVGPPEPVLSGYRAMRLGNAAFPHVKGYSSIRQSVLIPPTAAHAALRFWYWSMNDGVSGALGRQEVILTSPTSPQKASDVVSVVLRESVNSRIWTSHEIDLSRFAGRSLDINFSVRNDGAGIAMFLDDVSVMACTLPVNQADVNPTWGSP